MPSSLHLVLSPLSFIHLSSILFLALPIKIVFLLSLLSPFLSLLFSCSPLYDKNTRKEEQALVLSPPVAMNKEKSIGDKEGK